jgi:hypothetical protein
LPIECKLLVCALKKSNKSHGLPIGSAIDDQTKVAVAPAIFLLRSCGERIYCQGYLINLRNFPTLSEAAMVLVWLLLATSSR